MNITDTHPGESDRARPISSNEPTETSLQKWGRIHKDDLVDIVGSQYPRFMSEDRRKDVRDSPDRRRETRQSVSASAYVFVAAVLVTIIGSAWLLLDH